MQAKRLVHSWLLGCAIGLAVVGALLALEIILAVSPVTPISQVAAAPVPTPPLPLAEKPVALAPGDEPVHRPAPVPVPTPGGSPGSPERQGNQVVIYLFVGPVLLAAGLLACCSWLGLAHPGPARGAHPIIATRQECGS